MKSKNMITLLAIISAMNASGSDIAEYYNIRSSFDRMLNHEPGVVVKTAPDNHGKEAAFTCQHNIIFDTITETNSWDIYASFERMLGVPDGVRHNWQLANYK